MATCGVLPSSPASDELLAHGVRDGDDRAFELLYQRYWDPLRRYAGRLLRDVPAGEDAAQVAFANAYRALRAGQTPRSVRPWLYAIARNAAWGCAPSVATSSSCHRPWRPEPSRPPVTQPL